MRRTPQVRMNMLDRAISAISPERGLRRLHARAGLEFLAGPVERSAGGKGGTLFNWVVKRLSRWNESVERERIQDRAEDLVANDSYATSVIDSLSVNAVGTGLLPQAKPRVRELGIADDDAREFQAKAEWIFDKFCREADFFGAGHFQDLQYQAIYTMLMAGEYVSLPVMDKVVRPSGLSLCLQMVAPMRLRTPSDLLGDTSVRDGVKLDATGRPIGYWIANPDTGVVGQSLSSSQFAYYPARRGHRPGIFHGFMKKNPEQVRGVSILAPAMKSFRDLSDYLDFELVGAIVAASFPVWIDTSSPVDAVQGLPKVGGQGAQKEQRYKEVEPGTIMYGSGRPEVLESNRPGNSFDKFVETILRAVGASCGLPYEIVSKDFSKTNYSSARAALLEAWRVISLYRSWLVRHLCQPVYEMAIEEAWLRGELELPAGGPDFYDARLEYCNATWIGPPRGNVDPVREMEANILGLDNNILTYADVIAEQGNDWEYTFEQRNRENRKAEAEGLRLEPTKSVTSSPLTLNQGGDDA